MEPDSWLLLFPRAPLDQQIATQAHDYRYAGWEFGTLLDTLRQKWGDPDQREWLQKQAGATFWAEIRRRQAAAQLPFDEASKATLQQFGLENLYRTNPNLARLLEWAEGDAEFANTISSLSKGLRWDAEYDLERIVGPLGARGLVQGARGAANGVLGAGRRLAENVAEFLLEERPVLVRPTAVNEFAADVVRLRDDVERTAKRIAKLEQKLEQRLAQRSATPVPRLPHDPQSDS